jgi:hypothetical protein
LGIYLGMEGLVSELPQYPNEHPPLWNSISHDLSAAIHHPVVAVLSVPSPSSHAAAAVAALHDAHTAIGSFLSHLDSAVASYGDDQSMMEDGGEEANQMVREVEGLQNVPSRGDQEVEADHWQSMAAAPSTVIIHGGINVRSSLRLLRGGGRVKHRRGSGAAATLEPWAVSGWVRARLSQQI